MILTSLSGETQLGDILRNELVQVLNAETSNSIEDIFNMVENTHLAI